VSGLEKVVHMVKERMDSLARSVRDVDSKVWWVLGAVVATSLIQIALHLLLR